MAKEELSTVTVIKQVTAATTAALTGLCCGCWMGWPSPSIPKIQSEGSGIVMSDEEVSWMVAVLDVGVLISPLPSGYFMNNFGRKKTLICSGLLYLISWTLTAIAYDSWYLYVARFIAGLGKGITFTTLPIYLGEISSVSIRGALSTLMISMDYLGVILTSAIGPILSFKALAILLALFPIIFLIAFHFMPETPYYLLMIGNQEDALQAFRWLRGDCVTTEVEFEGVKECVNVDMKNRGRFIDLVLLPGNRRALIIALVIVILHRCMGGTSVLAYSSVTLPPHDGWFGPSHALVLYSCVTLFCSILTSLLIDRWGRRPIILFSVIGCGILYGVSAIFYYLFQKTRLDMSSVLWIAYSTFIAHGCLRVGIALVVETFQGELFPTNLRGKATAVCTVTISVVTFLIDKLFVTVDINVGVYVNFLFYCFSSVLCCVFVCIYVFETKGKSFMEIQEILRDKGLR